MPILYSGTSPQLNASSRIVLVGQQPFVSAVSPSCNRLVLPPIPTAIINNANTTVTELGWGDWRIEKTSGAGFTYDADAIGTVALTGDFYIRFKEILATAQVWAVGVDVSPATASDRDSIDYAMALISGTDWYIYENAAGPYVIAPNLTYGWIWRSGTTLGYGTGPTIFAAMASPLRTQITSATLYFDSTFSGVNTIIEVQLAYALPSSTAVTGDSPFTFANTGTINGTGALTGASSLTFAPTATATGKGALTASSTLVFSLSATGMVGFGQLTGTSPLVFAPSGTLLGKGAVTGSSTLAFAPAGTLLGKGSVTGSSSILFSPSGTAAGKGAVAGSSGIVFSPTATATGKGALTGASSLVLSPAGTLTGKGALTGASSLTFAPTGTLLGRGAIAASSSLVFVLAGTLADAVTTTDVSGTTYLSFLLTGTLSNIAAPRPRIAFAARRIGFTMTRTTTHQDPGKRIFTRGR